MLTIITSHADSVNHGSLDCNTNTVVENEENIYYKCEVFWYFGILKFTTAVVILSATLVIVMNKIICKWYISSGIENDF